jgi:hypothetical protein
VANVIPVLFAADEIEAMSNTTLVVHIRTLSKLMSDTASQNNPDALGTMQRAKSAMHDELQRRADKEANVIKAKDAAHKMVTNG